MVLAQLARQPPAPPSPPSPHAFPLLPPSLIWLSFAWPLPAFCDAADRLLTAQNAQLVPTAAILAALVADPSYYQRMALLEARRFHFLRWLIKKDEGGRGPVGVCWPTPEQLCAALNSPSPFPCFL